MVAREYLMKRSFSGVRVNFLQTAKPLDHERTKGTKGTKSPPEMQFLGFRKGILDL
jgi:hypothetical protein